MKKIQMMAKLGRGHRSSLIWQSEELLNLNICKLDLLDVVIQPVNFNYCVGNLDVHLELIYLFFVCVLVWDFGLILSMLLFESGI